MPSVAVLIADGFETVEALTVIDICRRAGIRTRLVSSSGTYQVVSAQQVQVSADERIDTINFSTVDCIVLPGGLPGVRRLHANEHVRVLVRDFVNAKTVAASGAAPIILGELGLLTGHKATVFPGYESALPAESYVDKPLVTSRNIITARSISDLLPFSIAIVDALAGKTAAEKIAQSVGVALPIASV